MLPIDDTDWLEDFRIKLSEREIADFVSDVGETLVFTKSKLAAAAWLTASGVAGGISGGVFPGIWSSWIAVVAYFVVSPAIWWSMRWLTQQFLGPAIRWQAVVLFFFTFLIGASAVFGARVGSMWWAYGVSAGMGLLLGLVYGSLDPTSIRNRDLWLVASLPLGPIGASVATYVHRHISDPSILPAGAIAGGVAAAIFAAPMMTLLVRLWDNSRGLRHLAILYLHNDAFLTKAVDYLTLALALAPNDAGLLNLRGIAWSRLGQAASADADWQRVRDLEPRSAEPLKNRGDVLLREGRVDEAVAVLESAVKTTPKHAQTHASFAIALARSGDVTRAIKHYDRAIALEPRRPSTYAYRAQARLNLGAFDRVVADCDRALEICRDFGMAYILRGQAHAKLGESEKAKEDYREALEVAADDEEAAEARRGLAGLS